MILVEEATHFSFLAKGEGVLPIPSEFIGPDPELAFPTLKALSTAFFKTYIVDQSEYSIYLNPGYLKSISTKPFELSLIKSLTENQLETAGSTANE